MRFSEIYGGHQIKEKLIKAVESNHVAHAQMFVGLEGSPNLATALAYATYINCENQQGDDSCGTCPSCQKMNKLVHPDMHFVFPMYALGSGDKEKARNALLSDFRQFILENPLTAIGTQLSTGTTVGVSANILKSPSRYVASFTWNETEKYLFDKVVTKCQTFARLKGQVLSDADILILEYICTS